MKVYIVSFNNEEGFSCWKGYTDKKKALAFFNRLKALEKKLGVGGEFIPFKVWEWDFPLTKEGLLKALEWGSEDTNLGHQGIEY